MSASDRPRPERASESSDDAQSAPGADDASQIDGAIDLRDGDAFPIVGIGASAGGLRAFQEFFAALPAQPGMAFVLVQHLSPDHESTLAELIQTRTQMTVTQVTDHLTVEPNRVYVIPPGKHLEIEDGHLQLVEARRSGGRPAAVDHFFRTLADDVGPRAVCIVLSGTGSDGSLGLKAVKERGGLTMAQAPADAEYDGMPRSAVDTDLVDVQATAAELAAQLVRIRDASGLIDVPEDTDDALAEDDHQALQTIFAHLRERTAHDFTEYKRSTILRRLARRLQVTGEPDLPHYAVFLRNDPDEVHALLRDFLISVTQFFRDREAFEALEADIVPTLFRGKSSQDQVRVWVAGCATGEEAYSVAMLLCEYRETLESPPDLQIFATDIDEAALAKAREGHYASVAAADVSPERLRRFFESNVNGVRVKSELRQIVLFANHNLLSDPPFSRLDLVACRNVLIYFNRSVQERVFATFHYALRPEGHLFLGAAEGPALLSKGFRPTDKAARIYVRRGVTGVPRLPPPTGGDGRGGSPPRSNPSDPPREGLLERYRDWTLDAYAPPRLLVDEHYDITHIFGDAGAYLVDREGPVTQNVVDKVLSVFRLDLRASLFRAFSAGEPTDTRFHRVRVAGRERMARLHVGPVGGEAAQDGLAEVVFIELDPETVAALGRGAVPQSDDTLDSDTAAHLEEELRQTRQRLQLTIEESETSNEELKASNEELQSINEELQSTTEELETSKEELQSTNEELRTVNQELKNKVEELVRSNSDLQNLIASTDIATLFLDRSLRLKRYTPRATELFHVLPGDTGRPFAHIVHRLRYTQFDAAARRVLETLVPEDVEVESEAGRWYSARISPYRTTDDRIDGVVLTFVDVTALREAITESARRAAQQAAVAELGRAALLGTDTQALLDQACAAAAEALGADFAKVLRHRPDRHDLILVAGTGWTEGLVGEATVPDSTASQAGYTLVAANAVVVPETDAETRFSAPPLLTEHNVGSGLSVSIQGPGEDAWGVLGIHSTRPSTFSEADAEFAETVAAVLSEALLRSEAEKTISAQLSEIETIYGTAPVGLAYVDPELRYRRINERLAEINGFPVDAHIGRRGKDLFPFLANAVEPVMRSVLETGEAIEDLEFHGATPRDPADERDWLCSYVPDFTDAGQVRGVSVVVHDVTERKRAENERAEAVADLDFVLDSVGVGVWSLDLATQAYDLDERTLSVTQLSQPLELRAVRDRVHPEDAPEIETQIRDAVKGDAEHSTFQFNARFQGDDGAQRWIEVRGRFLPDRGEAGTLSGIVYDTTELHQATDQARQRLAEIEAYFDAVPLAVSVIDLEGRYVRVNAQLERLTGRPADTLVGTRAADQFSALGKLTEPVIAEVIATGESRLGVPVQATPPGAPEELRDFLLYVQPVHEGERVIATTVAAQDVTDLTRAQAALRALTDDLEARVAERTAQVRGLAAELTRAEDAERQRLALVLHDDLQQILYGAQAQLNALQRSQGEAAELLAVKVDDALATAVQTCRTLSVDLSPPTLSEEGLERALDWVAHRFGDAHGLSIQVEGDTNVEMDPSTQALLIRVTRELLFNVVKHAGPSAVHLLVEAGDSKVCLEVIDDGSGFEPETTTLGFGLTSSRERLALIGGTFELQSELGAGTRVTICVPASLADLPPRDAPT